MLEFNYNLKGRSNIVLPIWVIPLIGDVQHLPVEFSSVGGQSTCRNVRGRAISRVCAFNGATDAAIPSAMARTLATISRNNLNLTYTASTWRLDIIKQQ